MLEENVDNHCLNSNTPKEEDCQSLFSLRKKDPSLTSIKIIPTFNAGGKFYTPSFILSSDMNKYVVNDEGYRMIHEKKIQQMEQQKSQILVPKPSKANSYCCICKAPFQDYLTHLNFPKHKQLLRKSPYCKLILDLCGNPGSLENLHLSKNRKAKKIFAIKKKKIITSHHQLKKGRGRPRKNISTKLQMLASIPTSISISV